MNLHKYASMCDEFLLELKQCLTREDISALQKDCADAGLKEWCAWTSEHRDDVCAFVASTPSQRLSKKRWQQPEFRRRLVLASVHHVQQARILLDAICQQSIAPGWSYRDMAANAGEAYCQVVYDNDSPCWPFSGENPFEP